MASEKKSFDVGTRKSKLALLQTDAVISSLQKAWPDHQFNTRARDTAAGDLDKVTPFKDMPVKNLWTHDLEKSLIDGELDLLVHSLKGELLVQCLYRRTVVHQTRCPHSNAITVPTRRDS